MAKAKKNKLKVALIIAAVVLVVSFAAGMIVTSYFMGQYFSRGDYREQRFTIDNYYGYYSVDHPREEVEFKSGGNTLKGFIYGLENDKGLLVFAHGMGGGHEGYMKELIWFVDNGWRVFGYDATGSGHSEGKGMKGLPQSVLDLDAALTFAESDERLNSLPVFLMGHSWGGYAVAAVLNFDHKELDIKGAASISGYDKPLEMVMEFSEGLIGGAKVFAYPFIWIYNTSLFGKDLGLSAVDGINRSGVPVLIIHGTDDGTVGYGRSSIISQKGKITNPNAQYLTLDDSHDSMFYTKAAYEYIEELKVEYSTLYDQYGGEIPDDVREEFYSKADRELINTPNAELLSQIERFFLSCPTDK